MHLRTVALALLLPPLACGSGDGELPEAAPAEASAGRGIEFPISCGAETQARFDRGVFLLHNMMYEQARAEFSAAAERNEHCAMLHWGVAMSHFHPLWPGGPDEAGLRAGAAAVERGRALHDATPALEQGFVEAVAAYFDAWSERGRAGRKASWAGAQVALSETFPEHVEARLFAGLARLATADPYDAERSTERAVAAELEAVHAQQPDHPGVIHYLIHAYDNPALARQGVTAAAAYERVAPDAPHALHMPSHIYVRIGDWPRVIAWNVRSRDVAAAQPVADGAVSKHFLHALDYLVYGHLQLGDDAAAAREAAKANAETRWQRGSGPAAYALVAIPARLALEREDWAAAAALPKRPVPYDWERYPWADAITVAARGLGAVRSGDAAAAEASLAELDGLAAATGAAWWKGRIRIERDVVAAWVDHARGDSDAAVARLRDAADRELAAGKLPVEPGHTFYAIEQLGDLLLELGRTDEARAAFERSLADSPGRRRSRAGAAAASAP